MNKSLNGRIERLEKKIPKAKTPDEKEYLELLGHILTFGYEGIEPPAGTYDRLDWLGENSDSKLIKKLARSLDLAYGDDIPPAGTMSWLDG